MEARIPAFALACVIVCRAVKTLAASVGVPENPVLADVESDVIELVAVLRPVEADVDSDLTPVEVEVESDVMPEFAVLKPVEAEDDRDVIPEVAVLSPVEALVDKETTTAPEVLFLLAPPCETRINSAPVNAEAAGSPETGRSAII